MMNLAFLERREIKVALCSAVLGIAAVAVVSLLPFEIEIRFAQPATPFQELPASGFMVVVPDNEPLARRLEQILSELLEKVAEQPQAIAADAENPAPAPSRQPVVTDL